MIRFLICFVIIAFQAIAQDYLPFEPTVFCARSGPISYKNQSFKWIHTQGGNIDLDHVKVTAGAYTDKNLTADFSELGLVNIGGKLWLENSCLCGTSSIGGEAWIDSSKIFAEIKIFGQLHTQNSRFYQSIEIHGNVDAKDALFEGTLQAAAKMVQLDHVQVQDVIIDPSGDYFDPPLINLKNSIVNGNIIFSSCKGKILLDSSSHIYGQVYGGNIIQPCNYNYDFKCN